MKGKDAYMNLAELETPSGSVRNEALTLAWKIIVKNLKINSNSF